MSQTTKYPAPENILHSQKEIEVVAAFQKEKKNKTTTTTVGLKTLQTNVVFFFKQKTAYEIGVRLVGSEMCIRDRSYPALLARLKKLFCNTAQRLHT